MYDKIAEAYINKEIIKESLSATIYHHDADEVRSALHGALEDAHESTKHLAASDSSYSINPTMRAQTSGRLDLVKDHTIPGNYYVGDMKFDKAILVGSNTKAAPQVKSQFIDNLSDDLNRDDLHFDEHKTIVTPTHKFAISHKHGSGYSTIGFREIKTDSDVDYKTSRNPSLDSETLRDVFGGVKGYGLQDKDVGMQYVNHPSANKDSLFDVAEKHEHPEVRKAALDKLRNM